MIARITGSIAIIVALTLGTMAQPHPIPEKISPIKLPPQVTGAELFVYTPWVKLCGRSDAAGPQICLTVMEVKREAGSFAAGAALIEGAGDKKILRVTLPSDVQRSAGARVSIDNGAARDSSFATCNPRGCLADFEASAEFIAKLKAGALVHLRGTRASGKITSYRLPLADFARANEGAPRTR
jgi:invasion protein IalB